MRRAVRPADPDPERARSSRSSGRCSSGGCASARGGSSATMTRKRAGKPDATIQTADFGVFIDFMSMFQPDDRRATTYSKPAQQASFGRALRNIGLLYGHGATVVFKLTATPLPPGGDPMRVYEKRGWTHLERRLGDVEAPASNSLDVAAWPTAEAERAAREDERAPRRKPRRRSAAAAAARVGGGARRAGRPRSHRFHPGTLGALIRGGRGAPVSPAHFEPELKEKVFSVDADVSCAPGSTAASPSRCSRTWRSWTSRSSRGRRRTGATWAARSRAARSCGS